MEPVVSIIIPVYNAEVFLDKSLESIRKQVFQSFEVILVDDGSSDRSKDIMALFSERDPRFKFVSVENGGPSKARNIALRKASGKYIQFMDSDDTLHEEFLSVMVPILEMKNDLAICGYEMRCDGSSTMRLSNPAKLTRAEYLKNFSEYYNELQFQFVWNKLYLRDLIVSNGIKFNETTKRGEDILFNVDYFKYVTRLEIVEKPLYQYNNCNTQSLTNNYNPVLFQDQQRIFSSVRGFLADTGFYEQNKVNLETAYIDRIIGCFRNLFMRNNNLSKKEKIDHINEIMNAMEVQEAIAFYKRKDFKGILNRYLIANKKTYQAYAVYGFQSKYV